jgi:hypothetical protein
MAVSTHPYAGFVFRPFPVLGLWRFCYGKGRLLTVNSLNFYSLAPPEKTIRKEGACPS